MRSGFTTGSCAAAAAKAAAYMLLFGGEKKSISITTPKGIVYEPEIIEISRGDSSVSCAVVKDGGDDPDVTSGAKVFARVSIVNEDVDGGEEILIDGGEGVGRVTKPGLDQPVGNAAINSVPRSMIENEVKEVCTAADFCGILSVIISVPGGEEIAKRTFNPRLGIEGGISVIGTSGIVEPMSTQAVIDTIKVELRQRKALGDECAFVSPGNYGVDFMRQQYGIDLNKSVKCSNFIGQCVDIVSEMGFKKLLLVGHIGKLVKVAGGIMNTHSKEADCRMEILSSCAILAGAEAGIARKILDCVVTDDALEILREAGFLDAAMKIMTDRILFYLDKRAAGKIEIEFIVFSNKFGELGRGASTCAREE